jgi:hypothetical protein
MRIKLTSNDYGLNFVMKSVGAKFAQDLSREKISQRRFLSDAGESNKARYRAT